MTTPVRRDNGLVADDYVRVARPHLAVAEDALDALRRTGIAAFVSPFDDDPERLELWVDARELDDVATVLASVGRHRFADRGHADDALALVGEEASFGDLDFSGVDDDDPLGTRNPTPSARPYPTPVRPRVTPARDISVDDILAGKARPGDLDGLDDVDGPDDVDDLDDADALADLAHPGDLDDDDPDDHFQPSDPESLRTLSRTTVWALVILAVGVVALALSGLAPGLVGAYAPLTSLLGTAAVLVGVGMLVTRLRDGRRDDGGGNDGGPNGDGAIL